MYKDANKVCASVAEIHEHQPWNMDDCIYFDKNGDLLVQTEANLDFI